MRKEVARHVIREFAAAYAVVGATSAAVCCARHATAKRAAFEMAGTHRMTVLLAMFAAISSPRTRQQTFEPHAMLCRFEVQAESE